VPAYSRSQDIFSQNNEIRPESREPTRISVVCALGESGSEFRNGIEDGAKGFENLGFLQRIRSA
jgi:hypothetical protein